MRVYCSLDVKFKKGVMLIDCEVFDLDVLLYIDVCIMVMAIYCKVQATQ